MRRSSLTPRTRVKAAAETQPASRKSREPKPKATKREKKRRRKVRRKQKVSTHFYFSHFHLPVLMSFYYTLFVIRYPV